MADVRFGQQPKPKSKAKPARPVSSDDDEVRWRTRCLLTARLQKPPPPPAKAKAKPAAAAAAAPAKPKVRWPVHGPHSLTPPVRVAAKPARHGLWRSRICVRRACVSSRLRARSLAR